MSPLGHITRCRGEVRGVLLVLLYSEFHKIATAISAVFLVFFDVPRVLFEALLNLFKSQGIDFIIDDKIP